MFERFTKAARQAVALAQDESRRFGDAYIGPEHLLLALTRQPETVAARVLGARRLDRVAVERHLGLAPAEGTASAPAHLPFTSNAKRALEDALREALAMEDDFIGTGHLLLGLLRSPHPIAADLLRAADITLDVARDDILVLRRQGLTEEVDDSVATAGRRRAESVGARRGRRTFRDAPVELAMCPRCSSPVERSATITTIHVPNAGGATLREVDLLVCSSCGVVIGPL